MRRPGLPGLGALAAALAAALTAAALAAALGGCGVGVVGLGKGGATLTVTRDFGAATLVRAADKRIPGGETVMRLLMRKADVETAYGGRFVNAVNGVRSRKGGGRRLDWFYYVNGIEAGVGAAERRVRPGDRVWWDYHDWTSAMRVPAVVGSYPEPFLHGSEGKRFPVRIDCAPDAEDACKRVAGSLDRVGAAASTTALGAATGKEVLRLVVGEWAEVRRDAVARQIETGPGASGVFARLKPARARYELELLDARGRAKTRLGEGAGLLAATRFEEQQPAWVVAGTDRAGLGRAVRLLNRRVLRNRFALATAGREPIPLPVRSSGGEGPAP